MAYPAINTLSKALYNNFSLLQQKFYDASRKRQYPQSDGMIARLQAAPKNEKVVDPHSNGLALDIFLFVSNPYEKDLADFLVYTFIQLKTQMGWSSVIYNRVTTDDYGGPKRYTGANPHDTHIHIEWPKSRGNISDFYDLLVSELQQYSHTATDNYY
jgi:hypothetical protein